MGLLQTLCLVKMDNVDGNKQDRVKTNAADSDSSPAGAATNSCNHPNSTVDVKTETEMKGENREALVVVVVFYENEIDNCWWLCVILFLYTFYKVIKVSKRMKKEK